MHYSLKNESDRQKAFPIHVDMGEDGPVLDLGERGAAVNLPEKGCVLVDYELNEDGTLAVKTVCLPAGDQDMDEEPDDLGRALDRAMAEAEEEQESDGDEETEED